MITLIVLLASLILWLPQNCIHEGAHAIMARIFGWKTQKFWPFPGYTASDGQFRFAYVLWAPGNPTISTTKRALIYSAPVLVNTTLICSLLFIVIITYICEASGIVAAILMGWAINNFVDGANNCRLLLTVGEKFPTSSADLVRCFRELDWSIKRANAAAIVWLALISAAVTVLVTLVLRM